MSERLEMPRYVKIAVDVAMRIYKGYIQEGEKLRGRSLLAGEYNVSPETIRKSMKLLEDKGVVEVNKGSGIIVKSIDKAYGFIESFKEKESIGSLRNNMKKLLQDKSDIERKIQDINEKIIDYSYRFRSIDMIQTIEVEITESASIIGKTIGDSEFWQNTGGTIIGVKRNDDILISPGPYLEFKVGDKILAVGDEGVVDKIKKFLGVDEIRK
ncbi:TrkA C-terminal domain-containing protein [Clostridium sp. MB40-C1]|uniref:TrkA C-terminal domain-containing protein n=1 Tax=Clostridium sp. MB40-C1 TaxID=3070996 RepID=UPI0027E0A6C4|nr:TrkA C-terminal domain-containing protein [Clostridium sp. MB40-C1]WMJ79809.1 TrkA C-terminal domain-containing protein [Clostridium sp. MB40-C1]